MNQGIRKHKRSERDGKTMETSVVDVKQRVEEFRENGYTIFESVYDKDTIGTWVQKFQQLLQEEAGKPINNNYLVSNMIELAPKMMLPLVANALILDFAEKIVGPFVQISDSVMFAFDSTSPEAAANRVNGWHRDRYAHVPRGGYHNPNALTSLCYLQDMTEEYGPLRVIPGSHRAEIVMDDSQKSQPHPDEILLPMKAGDVILFHNALLHTGTPNTSGKLRTFIGGSYNCTWMKHKDNHSGPNVQRLVQEAREANDHRRLRLFGIDEQLEKRINSGFTVSDDTRWAEWSEQDKAAIIRSN
jgi:ectoine hydroxylase-related dioxygenase (phytanoyl-CoA dioxygenase family)